MEFDDLKVIWDTQNDRPLYVIDQAALHTIVRKRGRVVERRVNIFEIATILIMLGMCIATAGEPILYGHDYHQFVVAALYLMVAVYLFDGRRQRLKRDVAFDHSLLGDLDKAIAQIDYQITRLRSFLWWFIVPVGIGLGISFVVLYDTKPVWIWPLVVLSVLFAWWTMRRDLRVHHLPKKRELESLRDKLNEK